MQHYTSAGVQKNERECLEYLHSLNIPKLSEAERNSCAGLLQKRNAWKHSMKLRMVKVLETMDLLRSFICAFVMRFVIS